MRDEKNKTLTRVAVLGVAGRMGRMLAKGLIEDPNVRFVGGTEFAKSPLIGTPLAELVALEGVQQAADAQDLLVSAEPETICAQADVVIDFALPTATERHLEILCETGTACVSGTTGLSQVQEALILKTAEAAPILRASNFSLGVNILSGLVRQAAKALPAEDWDIEILEAHHNQKIDAPSGTALALGEAAAKGRNERLAAVQKRSREGITGVRPQGEIGFATLRGGDVAGEHQVTFFGTSERIELGHRAGDRAIFARGAIHAAKWLAGREPGLYGMNNVLSLP